MSAGLQAISPQCVPCKCCGALADIYGLVDFHKNCELSRNKALGISGIPVYYHRCPACRFIFTTALDHFTPEDFLRYVYNDQYPLIDPEFAEIRPKANANLLCTVLTQQVRPARILDYGGGNGLLAQSLRDAGFAHVECYDPFVPRFSTKPAGRFDAVVCFEVLEHSTRPAHTLADIISSLTDSGFIFCSTLLQPADIDRQGLQWWYAAPRNAHVSLYSKESLGKLLEPFGLDVYSLDESYHVLYRANREFGTHAIVA
jgi:hypothetical protein